MRIRLVLLGGQTIALGLMMAFLVVPVSALFLSEYGAARLPYAYLAVAGAGVLVSWSMSRAQRRLSLARLTQVILFGYLVAVVAGWLVLATTGGLWVTFPLLVLFPLSIPVGFVLVGSQAGRLLDVRQMKAHFPRVAAGFSVGFAIGGLLAAALVTPLGGPEPLLALDGLAVLGMLVLARATAARFPQELCAVPQQSAPAAAAARGSRRGSISAGRSWRVLVANRLVTLIFGYQLLSAAVTQLLDYMVWERAAARFPDAGDLARFQGLFGAVINVTSVVFVVVVAGWFLTRFGIGWGLAANPLGILAILVATVVAGYGAGAASLLFFALVCTQQVTDISLTDGTTRTSINAAYQALQPEQRLRAQTVVEGAGVPLALGVVGLMLIVFDALALEVRTVAAVTLLLTILWVVVAAMAYREYGARLRDVLSRQAWDPVDLRIDDDASRRAVEQLLGSGDTRDVRAALEALAAVGSDETAHHLVKLLRAAEPDRREIGIEVATTSGLLAVEGPVVDAVAALLDDPEPQVSLLAAAALARTERGRRELGRSLWLAGVSSPDATLQEAAVRAAVILPHRFFVPYLVGLASSAGAPAALLDALAAHADELGPRVASLLDDATLPRRVRERLVHALGLAGTEQARDLLVAHLDDRDPAILDAAAHSLLLLGHGITPSALDLEVKLVPVLERMHRCLQITALVEDLRDAGPLRDALGDETVASVRRVEVLLDLVHDPQALGSGFARLGAADDRERNTALEMLEVTMGRQLCRLVLPVLDPTVDAGSRDRFLEARCPVERHRLAEWLQDLSLDESDYWHEPWLRACALYAACGLLSTDTVGRLAWALLADPDPDVVETARWALDRSPPVASAARVSAPT